MASPGNRDGEITLIEHVFASHNSGTIDYEALPVMNRHQGARLRFRPEEAATIPGNYTVTGVPDGTGNDMKYRSEDAPITPKEFKESHNGC